MIPSLLDTDLYKFTMMQAVLHQFPAAQVAYRFKCRNAGIDLRPIAPAIRTELERLATLSLTAEESDYLRSLPFLTDDFVDLLSQFRFNPDYVEVDDSGPELTLRISGPWLQTILFEVPLLAIVNQLWFERTAPDPDVATGRTRLMEKIAMVRDHAQGETLRFSDFGTRRRFSVDWQRQVVSTLASELPQQMIGTSNVMLARELGLTPIGTMAHEFLQAAQALGPRLRDSQSFAFDVWAREFRGRLGIALSDVCGLDAFLRDFDRYFAKLYDGARHDSGDPFIWGERLLEHYRSMEIDPGTKTFVFSDGLTMAKALALHARFVSETNPVFGIGTHLTNDLGYEPLQIVIKMTQCNGQPVAKVSDSPGKTMCRDEHYLRYLRRVFQ
ncbi:MAG: nicotinate phosphoribosyltransferase [Magnetococcales bacterium]|nr:nicotinate phosphoribosyltransferase [Magnetococcales bacterium]